MNRSSLLRLTATLAVLGTTVLGSAPTALATTPTAQSASDTVIPPSTTSSPRQDNLIAAGPGGILHSPSGYQAQVWSTDSGRSTRLQGLFAYNGTVSHGADVLVASTTGQGYLLQDMDTGTVTRFTLPTGDIYLGAFGSRLVSASAGSPAALHIFSVVGGQQTMTTATGWPSGSTIGSVWDGDANSVLMSYVQNSQEGLALVDLSSGQVTPVFSGLPSSGFRVVLSDRYVGWYVQGAAPTLHLVSRANPDAGESTVSIPAPQIPGATSISLFKVALAGNNLILGYAHNVGAQTGYQFDVYQMPLAGGTPTLLLPQIYRGRLLSLPTGAVVLGGSGTPAWGVYRFSAASDGSVASTLVDSEAQATYTVRGLALSGGRLATIDGVDPQAERLLYRGVQWGGTTPTYGGWSSPGTPATTDCSAEATCAPPIADPWGVAQLTRNSNPPYDAIQLTGAGYTVHPGTSGGSLVDSDGQWVVYNGANGTQYIGTSLVPGRPGNVLWTRPASAAALTDTSYEWAAGTTPGSVSLIDLAHKDTQQTVQTGAPCVPTELQASVDRWIYWSCGVSGPAGVYDLATRQDITVPSGYAELGDGYVITHDESRGELVRTDVHTDAPVTSDLAALPVGAVPDDRNVSWTVDRSSGGGIAYLDAQSGIHLVNSQVPASASQPAVSTTLQAGEQMAPGTRITGSADTLVMQADGNLVAYLQTGGTAQGPAIWASYTAGHPGAYAVMQADGNLVVYAASGAPLWASHTANKAGAHATVQPDGNVVVYAPNGAAAWATGTYAHGTWIPVGTVLRPGWWTQAASTRLVMQTDGNLVLYRENDGVALWSARTNGHFGAYAVMQPDGNLVVYRPGGVALWSSRTNGHPGASALLQDDGNFVVYRSGGSPANGGALWASHTNGR